MPIHVTEEYYFSHYVENQFLNQQVLCEKLWNNNDPNYYIGTSKCNPLTIRLLVTKDSLNEISKMSAFRIVTAPLAPDLTSASGESNLCNGSPSSVYPMASGSVTYFQYPLLNQAERQQPERLDSVTVHKSIYGFFTNLGAALNRVTFEIGKLYNFSNDEQLYNGWYHLFGDKNQGKITALLGYCRDIEDIKWTIQCRNRLMHDGILDYDVRNESIYLPENPNSLAPIYSKPIDTSCGNAFRTAIDVINRIYADISKEIDTKGIPLSR